MLVSIHMPRTGGTSFAAILKANFGKILEISERQGILDFRQIGVTGNYSDRFLKNVGSGLFA